MKHQIETRECRTSLGRFRTRRVLTQTPPSLPRWFSGFCTTRNPLVVQKPASTEASSVGFVSSSRAARAGVTLTQMLVVIALTGVITTAAITTIITMLRLEGRTTQVWLSQQTLLRLSDDFRSDAHAAKSAEIITQNAAPTVIFQSSLEATRSVTYLVADHLVTRRETDGDKLLRTEVYRMPDSQVTFGSANSKDEPPRLATGETVQLTCRRPNAPPINQRTPPPLHDEHIVAVIGRDHRFEKP